MIMSKRLHDTEIWSKQWFRTLSCEAKLLWMFLKDKCNCAGIIEVDDVPQIEFFIGKKISTSAFDELKKQFFRIDSKRIFLIDFIEFQYGNISTTHKMHKKIMNELAKFSIKYPIDTVSGVSDTVMDMDMDKDIEREEGVGEGKKSGKKFTPPSEEEFTAYCRENGFGNIAARAYRYYSEMCWKDSSGKPVRSWKGKLQAVWFTSENRDQEKQPDRIYGELL